jgi:hypothetical protein
MRAREGNVGEGRDDHAALSDRLKIFIESLADMTDEELFETFRLIEKERAFATAGTGEGESEDLALKEREAELEICRRHPDAHMRAYAEWLAAEHG